MLTKEALSKYTPPFKYSRGYIFDANQRMISDDGDPVESVARIRGWGYLSKFEDAEALQDKIGELMAQALTEFWERNVE